MTVLFLLLLCSTGLFAIDCPGEYEDGNDGSCYYFDFSEMDRNSAYRACQGDNAYIINVLNAFQNTNVSQLRNADYIYLGLTCRSSSVTSCEWDNGTPMTSSSYNNFNVGEPNIQNGACVALHASTGKWYSVDCFAFQAKFGCKYTPNINVPYCGDRNYGVFQGKCYYASAVYGSSDAIAYCKSQNFAQASIHSAGENAYVTNLALATYLPSGYINENVAYFGLQSNGVWNDGTALDYTNYGDDPIASYDCPVISLDDERLPGGKGKWMGFWPYENGIAICKGDPIA